jgi:Lrp/AsnC family transcriptional regulator
MQKWLSKFTILTLFPTIYFKIGGIMDQGYQIDQIDKRIIAELQKNASLSNAELAQLSRSSAASVWRRVRVLEKVGILLNSVRMVDASKIGCGVNVLCNVRARSHAAEARKSFEEFVMERPEILECFSMSGDWDYLLRIVARDVASYEAFLMRTLLNHPNVASASSHFALSVTKYTTALPMG